MELALNVSIEWNNAESRLVQQRQSSREKGKENIGQPVESFSNNVSVDGKIKLACSGALVAIYCQVSSAYSQSYPVMKTKFPCHRAVGKIVNRIIIMAVSGIDLL
jgi:hypothetical protein